MKKLNYILFISVFCLSESVGQTTFKKLYETNYINPQVYFDSLSGYYISGFSNVYDNSFIARLKPSGDVIWSKKIDRMCSVPYIASILTIDSVLIVSGVANTETINCIGSRNQFFIANLDTSNGTLINQNIYGDSISWFKLITKSISNGDNNILSVGYSSFYDNNLDSSNGIIIKHDINLNPIWSKEVSFSNGILLTSVFENDTNEIFIVGEIRDPSVFYKAAILIKVNNYGTVIWSKKFDQDSMSVDFSDVMCLNGFIYCSGSYWNDQTGIYRGIVNKYDLNGNLIWSNVYYSSFIEGFKKLLSIGTNSILLYNGHGSAIIDTNGLIIQTFDGTMQSTSLAEEKNFIGVDSYNGIRLIKFDSLFNTCLSGPFSMNFYPLINYIDSFIQIEQYSPSYYNYGICNQINSQIVSSTSCLLTNSVQEAIKIPISVYQNIGSELIEISIIDSNDNYKISVFDIYGRCVYKNRLIYDLRIDYSSWSTGIYIININGNIFYTQKILKL